MRGVPSCAEMFEEALERIARRNLRYFDLVARIGRLEGLHLDGHDRAAHVLDHVGEIDGRNNRRHFALIRVRGGLRLTETAIVHASQGQGGHSPKQRGTDLAASAHDQRWRTQGIGPGRVRY